MKIERQRSLLKWMRRGTLLVALGVAVHLGSRFDLVTLPEEGCIPVSRYAPGSRLLVDRRPPSWVVGDCVFVEARDSSVHIVLLSATNVEGLFLTETDVPECPGVDPELLGWVETSSLLGRVVMALGR
jgi:hypothetical protein